MEVPSMDTVYQAISALYDNPIPNEKEKASLWLGDIQKSIYSWKIADELLQQKKDIHSCYFAAQTMRSKVQHNLSELPPEAVVSLRDSLVAHLEGTSPETSAAILTQLSLALADLALQMPSWQNCISDLIKLFANKNDFALLEVLTVLPQEIDSTSLKLGENRREDIKSELRSNSQLITVFLKENITNTQNSNVSLKIVKCLTSWVQVRAINIQEVPQNAVIGFCLQVLRDHSSINTLHDAASDCICALLHCLVGNNNNDNVEKLLFDSLVTLEESYHMAVAHEEEEKAANYARIFTELAETFLEKIIASTERGEVHFAMRSLELALMCVGHHDYEIAEITFNLWYRLSEEVYQKDYQPLTDVFKPHIERLIEALARHCQLEPDLNKLPEEGDEFIEFRMKVMGLIKDVVFIIGSTSVFRQMFATLQADLSWEQTEAALFVMQSVAKNILPEEYEYVPKVVEAILSMPVDTHVAVRRTCIQLLGELADWVDSHAACLPPALHFLIAALSHRPLAYAAATALQSICGACRAQAGGHAASLLEAATAADDLALPPNTSAMLMSALAASIGKLPPEQISVAMREATAVQLAGLTQLLKAGKEVRKGTSSDPAVWLDRVAALFRDVSVRPVSPGGRPRPDGGLSPGGHPALPAFSDALPVLQQLMDKFASDGRVMERVCRCVRFCVRCVGSASTPLLAPLCSSLQAAYVREPHSCVLYLGSVLLDELATVPEAVPHLLELLQALLPRAITLLQQPQGMRDNPDTVDDLFRLCIRSLQRIPVEFLTSGAAGSVLGVAAAGARLDHREANSSVMKFLHDLVRAANTPRPIHAQIQALAHSAVCVYGAELTSALLEASVLHLRPSLLGEPAEVLLELLRWQPARDEWLPAALQRLPTDRTAKATQQQCAQFHHCATRAEKPKELTRLLRDFAKLYR